MKMIQIQIMNLYVQMMIKILWWLFSGTYDPATDGFDYDEWVMWSGDPDDDNDNALDENDTDDNNEFVCSDDDQDTCDDCSSGTYDVSDDGFDYDTDGACDAGDNDDDNDGAADDVDSDDNNEFVCSDDDPIHVIVQQELKYIWWWFWLWYRWIMWCWWPRWW